MNARYLRVRITETYGHRWINLSEILINDGEYVPANTNPTFVADPAEVSGQYLPENMIDGNLSTGFKPNMEVIDQATVAKWEYDCAPKVEEK